MLTESEMRLQQGMLPEVTVPNLAAGKQAECVRISKYKDAEGDMILKVAGEGREYTTDEAWELISHTKEYRKELTQAGVQLPRNYALEAVETNDGWRIIMVDEFLSGGRDAKQALQGGSEEEVDRALWGLFSFLESLPSGDYPNSTKVMGDFKPDNFILANNSIYLIDYFAPKRYDSKDGLVTPYLPKIDSMTRETITFLCGDRRGQIARMLALINRQAPDHLARAVEVALSLNSDQPELVEYIHETLENNFSVINDFYNLKPEDMEIKI